MQNFTVLPVWLSFCLEKVNQVMSIEAFQFVHFDLNWCVKQYFRTETSCDLCSLPTERMLICYLPACARLKNAQAAGAAEILSARATLHNMQAMPLLIHESPTSWGDAQNLINKWYVKYRTTSISANEFFFTLNAKHQSFKLCVFFRF